MWLISLLEAGRHEVGPFADIGGHAFRWALYFDEFGSLGTRVGNSAKGLISDKSHLTIYPSYGVARLSARDITLYRPIGLKLIVSERKYPALNSVTFVFHLPPKRGTTSKVPIHPSIHQSQQNIGE